MDDWADMSVEPITTGERPPPKTRRHRYRLVPAVAARATGLISFVALLIAH